MKRKVAIVMGSLSDYPTLKKASDIFQEFEIEHEIKIISAHRSPELMYQFAKEAKNKFDLIIAGASGAAHLPGMIASLTTLPVIGVPVKSKDLNGIDSLLSICQMPSGIPVGTMAIGEMGSTNAALFAIRILAVTNENLQKKLITYHDGFKLKIQEMQNQIS